MKIGVFGATGPTGLRLVQQSLDAGHHVVAFVRNPEKLSHIEHENLSKVKVDIFSAEELQKEYSNSSIGVVMSCLGARPKISITDAMKATGLKRFICVTAALQKREGGESFLLKMFAGYFIKTILVDMTRMESYLFENCQDLDVTIVRPTGLTNDPLSPTDPIIIPDVHFNKEDGHRIPRANVAKIMLDAMEGSKWVGQAVYASMPPNFEKGTADN